MKHLHFTQQAHALSFRKRLRSLTFLMLGFLMCSILIRLIFLQVIHYHSYQTQSQRNYTGFQMIWPKRGLIYDRHNQLIADNQPIYQLKFNPSLAHPLLKHYLPTLTKNQLAANKGHLVLVV